MKPRISVFTLGVADLERSVAFYRDGLGLKTEGLIGKEFEYGSVAFFELQKGLRLALWPKKSISKDTNIAEQTSSSLEFTIGHNVNSKEEVDLIMRQAERAGAKIVKSAQDTFMVAMQATSKTPMGICGKWFGILHLRLMSSTTYLFIVHRKTINRVGATMRCCF